MTNYFFHCHSIDSLIHIEEMEEWLDKHLILADDPEEEDAPKIPQSKFSEMCWRSFQDTKYRQAIKEKMGGWKRFPNTINGIMDNVVRNHLKRAYLNDPYFKDFCEN